MIIPVPRLPDGKPNYLEMEGYHDTKSDDPTYTFHKRIYDGGPGDGDKKVNGEVRVDFDRTLPGTWRSIKRPVAIKVFKGKSYVVSGVGAPRGATPIETLTQTKRMTFKVADPKALLVSLDGKNWTTSVTVPQGTFVWVKPPGKGKNGKPYDKLRLQLWNGTADFTFKDGTWQRVRVKNGSINITAPQPMKDYPG